jgi:hypothetical protein
MKELKLLLITICFATLLSGSIVVTALNPGEASIRALVSNPQPRQGDSITVTLFFENNSTETLTLTHAGIHFDWMPRDGFFGFNMTSSIIQVRPGETYIFPNPVTINVPPATSPGVHSYYAGVDGYDSSQAPFSIDSTTATIEVIANDGQTTAPTNPGSENQGGDETSDLLLYGAIAAVVIIVGLLIVVVVMRKKKSHTDKPRPADNQPSSSEPEQKPPGQDFSI